jgi:hypothetical protein
MSKAIFHFILPPDMEDPNYNSINLKAELSQVVKIKRIESSCSLGRGADLETVLVELCSKAPSFKELLSGFRLTFEAVSAYMLFKKGFENIKKYCRSKQIAILAPRETLVSLAAIALINKYHKFYKKIEEIRLVGVAEYLNRVDCFEVVELREKNSDDDEELSDSRTTVFVFQVRGRRTYFRVIVVIDNSGRVITIAKIY